MMSEFETGGAAAVKPNRGNMLDRDLTIYDGDPLTAIRKRHSPQTAIYTAPLLAVSMATHNGEDLTSPTSIRSRPHS